MTGAADVPSIEVQALLDAAVDAVVLIDGHGCIEHFSKAAERLFGYEARELLGRNIYMLMTEQDAGTHDAYLERYERTHIPHIIGIGREVRARRKDGSIFTAFLSVGRIGSTVPARYVGFLQDLTVREQALAAAVRERDRANGYLEAVQTILLALTTDGRVMMVNRKGCEILGRSEAEMRGLNWFEIAVPEADRAQRRAQFEEYLQRLDQGPWYSEWPICGADGSLRLIAWRHAAMPGTEGLNGILCSGDDITDARRAQEEARESRERMMHVSRLATMGEMAAGISHELNQPLAAITTFAQAARRLLPAEFDPDVCEALDQIANQALRAGEIIRRLRGLVRNRETQREPTRVNTLIQELGPLTRADARLHDVRVRLDLTEPLPVLDLDPIQIQQVLLNLVRNAVQALQYSDAAEREVLIATRQFDADIEIRVSDTGTGVAPEIMDRLFQPFATTKSDGTGLGLAISRTIIESHRGTLRYEPNQPRGACFKILLPIRKDILQ
jgi:two-component system sensor kinase FixL